ncbi:flagellar protein export ATPase FliI [Rhodohalobacter mucosus]|uniref:Flagellar protein export ATPase FliI n=1 Tax=Rhodohalobacter mucosus TaxID=2079485 RepID=A0A316TQ92_9BACT|nr:flagellar protein export ATPase FliI [Rhodohalobacter mucosus]PWN05175.1 flagellar protein export ATPase FliI [Rhodohalobacter mucosus]
MFLLTYINEISSRLDDLDPTERRYGKVSSVIGTVIEATGLDASVGELHVIHTAGGSKIEAEVVGIRDNKSLLMPLDRVEGIKSGCLVEPKSGAMSIRVSEHLLGRVIDANGNPIDSLGPVEKPEHVPVHNGPPGPMERKAIDTPLITGIRAIDGFTTLGRGQRIGIFAGSGVGKSTLMGMIAKESDADVNVIALIGERGREVKEFIDEILGPEGLRRSVVVATTSDKAAMSRVKAAFTASAVAEYFRDRGKNVLLMMDSVTRVAMAQREIGLASGEPPTTKGYTPSVFAMLPQLLERAGSTEKGSITGLYTVLVDNDDMNEPIADAVRSILDGHIVLSRKLAHKNHYPAIDVLSSISRIMNQIVPAEKTEISQKARELLAVYAEAEDLINIGAYSKGSNPKIDEAIGKIDELNAFLKQGSGGYNPETLWNNLGKLVADKKKSEDGKNIPGRNPGEVNA